MNDFTTRELKDLFDGKHVSALLPYDSLDANPQLIHLIQEGNGRLSISGAQEKYAVVAEDGRLRLTRKEENGRFIIKPIPTDRRFLFRDDMPANEALTMSIARDIFHLEVAAHGICYLGNGDPVYITRRFDYRSDGAKLGMEDFASLAGLSESTHGRDFKYSILSYEDCALLIQKYCSAPQVDLLKFYHILIFNFLFSNADAHIKNFSLLEHAPGEYRLAPAYDLLNTQMHIDSPVFALEKGLFKEGTPITDTTPIGRQMFQAFGERLGIPQKVIARTLDQFCTHDEDILNRIQTSLMSEAAKTDYSRQYLYRRSTLLE